MFSYIFFFGICYHEIVAYRKEMRFLIFVISIMIPFIGDTAQYKYDLSICAIFQDEAPYLKEWIEYHRLLGVQHFWLYNNSSQDNYLKILKPYIKKDIVELIDWPSPVDKSWIPYQKEAYNDCILRSKEKTCWLAVIDIDEFIVTTNKKPILENLIPYKDRGGLFLFWQMFGTSGLWDIPKGQCLIESLTWKAQPNFGPNKNSKTICRPDRVNKFFVHGATYLPPYHDCSLNGYGGPNQPIQLHPMHINHYWTRTKKFFYEVKIPRRERFENSHYSEQKINRIILDYNKVEDKPILYWVPQLKERLKLED